jgi:type IV pilus assembly protein PilC
LIYLQRIDEALENRTEIVDQLKSMRLAPESVGFRSDIDAFIQALQGDSDAKHFIKEGSLAAWIPAILEWNFFPKQRSRQLSQLAEAISRAVDIRWTRSHALTYLGVLFFAVLATFTFLCATVIPVFDSIFKDFGLKLPYATKIVLRVSALIGPHAKSIFLIVISSCIMLWLGKRMLRRLSQDRFIASYTQIFSKGSSSRIISMSRWLFALSSLLRVGAPLREAIIISGRASQSELLVQHAVRLATELKALPIEQCPSAKAFPPIVVDSLRENGLTRGDRQCTVDLLRELGVLYCERARHRHELMLKFLQPLFILLIGGGVAFVALTLFLPLISLLTAF